jgi:putative tryptophan/tyrosine transport system substrate-binding protein
MHFDLMNRREFITLFGGAAAAWPLAVRAQQPAMPVVGFLNSGSPGGREQHLAAFRQGLGETGYVDGRNVTIEYRWAEGRAERYVEIAAEFVRRKVDTLSGTAIATAKQETSTIPIVFAVAVDPERN